MICLYSTLSLWIFLKGEQIFMLYRLCTHVQQSQHWLGANLTLFFPFLPVQHGQGHRAIKKSMENITTGKSSVFIFYFYIKNHFTEASYPPKSKQSISYITCSLQCHVFLWQWEREREWPSASYPRISMWMRGEWEHGPVLMAIISVTPQ